MFDIKFQLRKCQQNFTKTTIVKKEVISAGIDNYEFQFHEYANEDKQNLNLLLTNKKLKKRFIWSCHNKLSVTGYGNIRHLLKVEKENKRIELRNVFDVCGKGS